MPGFMINGGGGGDKDPPNTIELLFSHRWYIETLGPISARDLIACKDLSLPDMRLDKQEVLGGLIWYKFAKSVRYEDAQITFYDNNKISDKLEDWKTKIFSLDGGIKSHKDYKKDSVFILTDGQGKQMQKFTLKHSWPSTISPGKLTYTSSEIKIVTVTLTFDFLEFVAGGSTSSGGSDSGSTGTSGASGGSSGASSSSGGGSSPSGPTNDSELLSALGIMPRDMAAIDKAVGFNRDFLNQNEEE